ncbi:hypothetical protein D1AOALGA4SA_12839 [Olavius algarvensis Delta 1 endosymbiont]|nr:hypothetical protein D1AOALGA4SA_12839 [Olavius algarvensis Delta 1 endosymbiont]
MAGYRFRVQGSRFRVQGSRFRVPLIALRDFQGRQVLVCLLR